MARISALRQLYEGMFTAFGVVLLPLPHLRGAHEPVGVQ